MLLEISESQYDQLFDQFSSGHTPTTYDTTPDASLLAIQRGDSVTIAKHLATDPPTDWILDNDEDHRFETTAFDIKNQIDFHLATAALRK